MFVFVASDRRLPYLVSVASDRELHVTFVLFACSLLRFKGENLVKFNFEKISLRQHGP